MPVALTVNVALPPLVTVRLCGCVEIPGPVAAALTVNVADAEAEPAELVTVTE